MVHEEGGGVCESKLETLLLLEGIWN